MTNLQNLNSGGVALEGYDPVSYFSNNPLPGNGEINSSYQGATYHFTTEENKAQFDADPEKYLPQYGGFCAVAVSEGKLVPVNPETYKITDDKLYLFYNGEHGNTKPQWEADEEKMKIKADEQWAKGEFES
jgi:YHS domain-containing protein